MSHFLGELTFHRFKFAGTAHAATAGLLLRQDAVWQDASSAVKYTCQESVVRAVAAESGLAAAKAIVKTYLKGSWAGRCLGWGQGPVPPGKSSQEHPLQKQRFLRGPPRLDSGMGVSRPVPGMRPVAAAGGAMAGTGLGSSASELPASPFHAAASDDPLTPDATFQSDGTVDSDAIPSISSGSVSDAPRLSPLSCGDCGGMPSSCEQPTPFAAIISTPQSLQSDDGSAEEEMEEEAILMQKRWEGRRQRPSHLAWLALVRLEVFEDEAEELAREGPRAVTPGWRQLFLDNIGHPAAAPGPALAQHKAATDPTHWLHPTVSLQRS